MKTTTTNFADFGYRERKLAAELLTASVEQGFPEDFNDDGVEIMMNCNSGYVFFTNSDFQVAMMNGDDLESFYTLPWSGEEGFAEELRELDLEDLHEEDIEYMVEHDIIEEVDEDGS
jgi:hypothetical protein